MTIFVELTTAPIEQQFKKVAGSLAGEGNGRSSRAGRTKVRRPTRGLEIKDNTYATLKVIKSNGESIPLVDSGSKDGQNTDGYANFLLQSVAESRLEKHQIIETFGASYVFFFGEQPRFLEVSAQLLNTHDFNWEAEWWTNYNTYLRGTKLVEMGARCYLSYDDTVVEGYIMQAQASKTADAHLLANLQFRFFVTNCYNVSQIGSEDFPVRYSAIIPGNISLQSGDAGRQLNSNLQGGPLLAALGSNLPTATRLSGTLIEDGSFAGRSISQLVRDMPPSFAVSADWWPLLENRVDLQNLALRDGNAIRGKIRDNIDEYLGTPVNELNTANYQGYAASGTAVSGPAMVGGRNVPYVQESEDLFRQSTESLSCYGADINNPDAYEALGISANFSIGVRAGASFSPQTNASFGFSASAGVGVGAVAGGGFSTSASIDGSSDSAFSASAFTEDSRSDSLGVIYGRVSVNTTKFSSRKQKVEETGFDFNFGYESDYASGSGFGKAGFGDYGGNGFGASNSGGDPGFQKPDDFTFAGVADERSAFERFTRKRKDRTALTEGRRVGSGELSGGASAEVGGSISAFALVSVEGELDIFGSARAEAQFQSDARVSQALGTRETIGGVNCPDPSESNTTGGGLTVSASAGASFSAGASASTGSSFSANASLSASASASVSVGI